MGFYASLIFALLFLSSAFGQSRIPECAEVADFVTYQAKVGGHTQTIRLNLIITNACSNPGNNLACRNDVRFFNPPENAATGSFYCPTLCPLGAGGRALPTSKGYALRGYFPINRGYDCSHNPFRLLTGLEYPIYCEVF